MMCFQKKAGLCDQIQIENRCVTMKDGRPANAHSKLSYFLSNFLHADSGPRDSNVGPESAFSELFFQIW
jgi:hypothetical protein